MTQSADESPAVQGPPAPPLVKAKLPWGLRPATWWTGAVAGAGAYVGVLVFAFVLTLLAVAGMAASGSGDSVPLPDNGFVSDDDLPSPWSMLFQFAAQLPALAVLGGFGGSLSADLGGFGSYSANFSVFFLPLLITAGAIAALWVAGRMAEQALPSPGRRDRMMQSVAAGAAFTLLVNLVATLASISISTGEAMSVRLNAANVASIFVAFLLGTAVTFLGRSSGAAPVRLGAKSGFVVSLVRDAVLTVTTHAAVFLVIAIPVVVIVLGVKGGWSASLSSPLWAPTAGLLLLGLGHFAAFGTVTKASGGGAGGGASDFGYGVGGVLADFGVPVWAAWLLVLLALVAVVAAGLYWYLRRGAPLRGNVLGWVTLPVAFLLAGCLLVWFSGVRAGFSFGPGGGSYSVGLAWWTPFLMMAWGVLAVVAAQYAGPVLASLLPAAWVARLQRGPSPLNAAGVPATPAPGLPGGPPPPPGTVGAPAAVAVEHKPLSKKAKRNLVIGGGAAALVIVLLGGGAIAANVVRGNNGPDKVVSEFLGALVDGDAQRALTVADPSIPNAERVLLTNEIYQKATERPDGFTILKTVVRDDSATVTAELRQNGIKTENSYRLLKNNPGLLNDNWQLKDAGIGALSFAGDKGMTAVLVNGVEVPLTGIKTEFGSSYSLPALPGSYSLDLPASSKYLSAVPATAVVSIRGDRPTETSNLEAAPNEAFEKEVQTQVSAALAACAKQTKLEPEGCPFSTYEFSDTRNVSWKIDKEPSFDVYQSEDNVWSLSTNETGEATVTYERDTSYGSDAPKWKADTDETSIYLRGDITVDKDTLTVKLSD